MPSNYMGVLRGAWLAVAAVGLTYLFIVVLMTASAQQRVTAALTDGEKIDYSTALVRLKESDTTRNTLDGLLKTQRALLEKEDRTSSELSRAKLDADNAYTQFFPIARRAAAAASCAAPLDGATVQVWNAVLQCAREGSLPPRIASQVEAATSGPNSFGPAYTRATRLETDLGGVRSELTRTAGEIAAKRAELAQAEKLRATFSELNVLRGSWMVLGGFFVEFPPSLMQIILAFVSGGFGALLITLILIVYPNSGLGLVKGDGQETRIWLGGLIALCVYIVLSGGSAILGTAQTLDTGQANVMTFSAVGVLAGMFSDRVAGWLSSRASAFFKSDAPVP